ncbi:MAG: 50S ribosomal protein L11 methyltransferase [Rhodothermales bacterium]
MSTPIPPTASPSDTVELSFTAPAETQERLIAELDARGFVAFLQDDGDGLKAYVPATAWGDDPREHLTAWLRDAGIAQPHEERSIPQQDWNTPWEASIEPVAAGPFIVRASWHPPMASERHPIELVIDPKMSFGTGHHESTRLVLGMAPSFIRPGMRVLDAGTGTGILGIAALKLGAAEVIAFDNDPWIEENAKENVQNNGGADAIAVRIGGLEVIPETGFDVVLANINKNVLIAYMPELAARLKPGGTLALAGLLLTDRDEMLDHAARNGLTVAGEARENTWWAVHLARGGVA